MDSNDTRPTETFPEVAYLGFIPDEEEPLLIAFESVEMIPDCYEVVATYVLDSVQRVRRSVALEPLEVAE